MQGIEFETDKNNYKADLGAYRQSVATKQGPLVRFVMKLGVKDLRIINFILLGVAVLCFSITIFLYADLLGFMAPVEQLPPVDDLMFPDSTTPEESIAL